MATGLRRITFEVDELDHAAIQLAITEYQRISRWPEGGTLLPDGEGDLGGRILGEICRGWSEYMESVGKAGA